MIQTINNKITKRITMLSVLILGMLIIGTTQAMAQRVVKNSEFQPTTVLPAEANGDVYKIAASENPRKFITPVWGTKDSTDLKFWGEFEGTGQQWLLVPTVGKTYVGNTEHTQYLIVGRASGLVLTPWSTNDCHLGVYDKRASQKWLFIPAETAGDFYIRSAAYPSTSHAQGSQGLTRYGSALQDGSVVQQIWQDQQMKFKLSKATEYVFPKSDPYRDETVDLVYPRITWRGNTPVFPKLDKPFATSKTYLPAVFVHDRTLSLPDKMNVSPYYTLLKESFLNEVITYHNDSECNTDTSKPRASCDASPTYLYQEGITKTQSQSQTDSLSVSFTVGTGEKSPVQFSVTAGYEHAWTTEESSGQSTGTSNGAVFQVAPDYAAGLYTIKYVFTMVGMNRREVHSWEVLGKANYKQISSGKP